MIQLNWRQFINKPCVKTSTWWVKAHFFLCRHGSGVVGDLKKQALRAPGIRPVRSSVQRTSRLDSQQDPGEAQTAWESVIRGVGLAGDT
jgi:hypothetical protein